MKKILTTEKLSGILKRDKLRKIVTSSTMFLTVSAYIIISVQRSMIYYIERINALDGI